MAENTQFVTAVGKKPAGPISALNKLAAKGAIWSISGYGTKQVLRFGGNLLLSRLLAPAIFGHMALVNVFILGLELFSDIGINASVVQNERGDDPEFLDTAWTLQVLRGLLLGVLACALAWPMSLLFKRPILLNVLPVAGLIAVIRGFNSTRLATAQRKLEMNKLVGIEVSSYVIGLCVMVPWAYMSPSIWAMVAGGITTALAEMTMSHLVLSGHKNKLFFERSAFEAIYRFGRWVFLSTAFTFLANQSDRLIIGRLMDEEFLGVYFIAFMFASLTQQAITQMGYKVFFPSYSKLVRDNPSHLYTTLRRARIALIGLTWVGAIGYIGFGYKLIDLLYDERYIGAGWMLRILAAGSLIAVLSITYDNVLVALGKTQTVALLMAIQLVLQVSAMLIGANIAGQFGIIVGLAAVGTLIYPFKAFWLHRYKLWQPEVDIPVIAGATTIIMLVLVVT